MFLYFNPYFLLNNTFYSLLSIFVVFSDSIPAFLAVTCRGQQGANFLNLNWGNLFHIGSYHKVDTFGLIIFFFITNIAAWIPPSEVNVGITQCLAVCGLINLSCYLFSVGVGYLPLDPDNSNNALPMFIIGGILLLSAAHRYNSVDIYGVNHTLYFSIISKWFTFCFLVFFSWLSLLSINTAPSIESCSHLAYKRFQYVEEKYKLGELECSCNPIVGPYCGPVGLPKQADMEKECASELENISLVPGIIVVGFCIVSWLGLFVAVSERARKAAGNNYAVLA